MKQLIEKYVCEKRQIQFFDINCWLGDPLPSTSLGKTPETANEFLDVMNYYRIEKAVVASALALNYNVVYGNKKLLEEIGKSDRLYAAAILLPEHTGELGNLSDYISILLENKVVMVRLFPKTHNFVTSEYCLGTLLKLLEERRIPLAFWHTQISWDELDRMCRAHSRLPIIIEGVGKKLLYHNRIFYSLLKKHKNLFLETHNITNYLGLDDIVEQLGAEKLIFGTCMPKNDPEAGLMPIVYGKFSLEEKLMMAKNNFLSLIKDIERQNYEHRI